MKTGGSRLAHEVTIVFIRFAASLASPPLQLAMTTEVPVFAPVVRGTHAYTADLATSFSGAIVSRALAIVLVYRVVQNLCNRALRPKTQRPLPRTIAWTTAGQLYHNNFRLVGGILLQRFCKTLYIAAFCCNLLYS